MRAIHFAWIVVFLGTAGAQDLQLPDVSVLDHLVRKQFPDYFVFEYFKTEKTRAQTDGVIVSGTGVVTAAQHLYRDVTAEILPGSQDSKAFSGRLPPVVLRKLHGAGEIIEVPLTLKLSRDGGGWKAALLNEDAIAVLGQPRDAFRSDAVIQGTPQADQLIRSLRSEQGGGGAREKKADSARDAAVRPSSAISQQGGATVVSNATAGAAANLTASEADSPAARRDLLFQACAPLKSYVGLVADDRGVFQAILWFEKEERNGEFVEGEMEDQSNRLARRKFTGGIRPNPQIPQQFELYLIASDRVLPGNRSRSAPAVTRIFLVLACEDDGILVGDIRWSTSSSLKGLGTPLVAQTLKRNEYPLRFILR